ADHPPAVSNDNGGKYQSFKHPKIFQQSTAFASSRFKNNLCLYGAISLDEKKISGIIKVKDEQSIPQVVLKLPKGYFVQVLKEDYHTKGRFYAYIEGPLAEKAGLYISEDWGNNWQKINLDLPDYIKTLPHRAEFIENELLNIVVGQRKNVCGTNKLLEVDPFQPNTIYFGEWTEGLFKSTDHGENWFRIDSDLPFDNNYVSTLTVVKSDPERKNRLYAGFVREGLWYSDNGGGNWNKMFPLDGLIFNATSIALKDKEIYLAGEQLFHAQCEPAVYFSPDLGATWYNIMDKNLGALRIKGIALEKKSGRLHVVTSGNGCFYVDCNYV
ncbi:MAG: WD40/YVTN/BNR-like repeat-containing protein, partial [Bacillota bacterium]